ncbi:hypothetical protein BGZ61DRAFT_65052 [Ilyonectria robusta]|uniref:uncharacterized protein n=1 Tax=Ilyonectria robusta TaxID=1079257 RepID=UPI001E8D61AF|nr:uncharacterized protein BGZ61DRAFT_65052 [Ilyonectria robusta]KAH8646445.1 hypothetical protein BGZ61DRAFT_65052 [Ilyonectria robusta]
MIYQRSGQPPAPRSGHPSRRHLNPTYPVDRNGGLANGSPWQLSNPRRTRRGQ